MKWTETHSGLPRETEMVAGPIALGVFKGIGAWEWSVLEREDGEPDIVIASGKTYVDMTDAQARCLAVANGILLQRVREARGIKWAHCSPCMTEGGIHGWLVAGCGMEMQPTETEALLAALKAAP